MTPLKPAGRWLLIPAAGLCLLLGSSLSAQAPSAPPATSATAAKVKELIALMQSKKLEAIAARDPEGSGRFVAVLHIPGVQVLAVSAAYAKPSELDSRLYYKDFMNAYVDLNTSIHSSDKVFIEDALCDGLVALPGKNNLARDSVKLGTEQQVFDGDYAAPNQRNSKKVPHEVYQKRFTTAEERYLRVLGLLIDEVKKVSSSLASPASLR
jgi:hypothetical protein